MTSVRRSWSAGNRSPPTRPAERPDDQAIGLTGAAARRWHDRTVSHPRLLTARRALVGLLAAAALAACSSTVAGSAVPVDQSGGGAADASVSPAPVPAGLEEFYSQELDWGSCAKLATSDDTSSTGPHRCSARI